MTIRASRSLLLCDNAYGADLRTRGQFNEALELDLELAAASSRRSSARNTNAR